MTPTRRGRLAIRLYGFAVLTVVLMFGLMLVIAAVVKDPHMQPYGYMLSSWSRQLEARYPDPVADRDALIAAIPEATADFVGDVALHDGGRVIWHRGDSPRGPSAVERAALAGGGAAYDEDDRIVAGFARHPGLYLAYDPHRKPPLVVLALVIAAALTIIAIPALWFARGIARPLRRLEAAAEAFGAGDVTARARATDRGELGAVAHAFDTMADRVELLLRSQRELLADISHELHTPLARIRVALELATEDPEAARDVLGEVGVDLTEIEQIIDDLLTVVRLDLPDGNALRRRPVALGELLRRSRDRFATLHPRRALQLVTPEDPIVVRCDDVLIRRALDNLIDNATKYSEAVIEVELRRDGGRVIVEVVDRGIGMNDDELVRAFTPFWRADHSRTRGTGGVGLGLALARRVARAHGGDVELRSRRGEGTTASLSMPVDA